MNSSAPSSSEDITGCEGTILVSNTKEARAVTVILIIVSIITARYKFVERTCDNLCENKNPIENQVQYSTSMLSDYILLHGGDWTAYFYRLKHSKLQQKTSYTYCLIRQLSSAVLTILARATILHLALMYLDMYIAMKHPYRCTNMVTATRILCSSAFVWIVALLSTATSFVTKNLPLSQLTNVSMIIISSGVAIVIFCQVTLYYETRRHEKQITANQVSEDDKQKFVKEKKALKLTTTVLFVLVLTYLPLIVVTILYKTSIESSNAAHIASEMVLINSLINPVIYCIRRRQFRVAFIEILFRKSNLQAQEIGVRVIFNGAREGLRWRSQNKEQETSRSTAHNTVEWGINNIG